MIASLRNEEVQKKTAQEADGQSDGAGEDDDDENEEDDMEEDGTQEGEEDPQEAHALLEVDYAHEDGPAGDDESEAQLDSQEDAQVEKPPLVRARSKRSFQSLPSSHFATPVSYNGKLESLEETELARMLQEIALLESL